MKKSILILPIVLLALVACAPGAEPDPEENSAIASPDPTSPTLVEATTEPPPTTVSEPTTVVSTTAPPAQPTAMPTEEPIMQPTELPTEEPAVETAVLAGRLDEGAFFLGAVDAPVTMIDYSDFL